MIGAGVIVKHPAQVAARPPEPPNVRSLAPTRACGEIVSTTSSTFDDALDVTVTLRSEPPSMLTLESKPEPEISALTSDAPWPTVPGFRLLAANAAGGVGLVRICVPSTANATSATATPPATTMLRKSLGRLTVYWRG